MANTEFIEPEDPLIGKVIGGEFTVVHKIGAGGMGSVYRAIQQVTERSVALKVLHSHLVDGTFLDRFTQEAKIISRLSHPNIVTVFKYGQSEEGSLYIAMELVDGSNLSDLIVPEWFFEVERALPLMVQMADALAYAHEKKIIHRDIKPENIVLTKTGRRELIKVLDFGVAKIIGEGAVRTKTGALCGSPPYMSPEQWQQLRDIDGRMDIYSLGCVFYRMVTGTAPFEADTTVGYMKAHLNQTPRHPLEVSESLSRLPELADVILRCIRRERDERYSDAYALLEDLKTLQTDLDSAARGGSKKYSSSSPIPLPSYIEPTPLMGGPVGEEIEREIEHEMEGGAGKYAHSGETDTPVGRHSEDELQAVGSSFDNLPAKSSGTNIAILSRGYSSSGSNAVIRGEDDSNESKGLISEKSNNSILNEADVSQENEESLRLHKILVSVGLILLVLLLFAGVYIWLYQPDLALFGVDNNSIVIEPNEQ